MANNIEVTQGSGTTFKTTDTAGVHTGHVNVDSSALPTGAATAAKQPALGTAGSASTDVITVQGIASGTTIPVTASAGTNLNTSALALEAGGNLALALAELVDINTAVTAIDASTPDPGPQFPDESSSVVLAKRSYETVAASQTAQALGATGATGDYLGHIVIQPSTTAPGVVTVLDNATTVYPYPGGTVDAALVPIIVPIDTYSVSGAWKITTGANVSVLAVGTFT